MAVNNPLGFNYYIPPQHSTGATATH